MWPDLGKPNILYIPSKLRLSNNFAIFSIYVLIVSELQVKYEHLQFYHQWATALCNAAIYVANIEDSKLACAHTQNRTFKMLDFCRSGHI